VLDEQTYEICWGQAILSNRNVSGAFYAFIVGAVRIAALATASHPAGDIVLAAVSSLLNALSVLAASCAFIVGAVRSAAFTTASHPAGDIVLAAVSSLR
jgi:GGDEF domain-containing protein